MLCNEEPRRRIKDTSIANEIPNEAPDRVDVASMLIEEIIAVKRRKYKIIKHMG